MIKTWAQLYDRLGRQPLFKTKESRIILKNEDGTFTPLVLVFDKNGANWWFEKSDIMSCIHLIKVDKTPWHGDVFDHPIYEFYCSYNPGDNIKLPHQYICKNCKYFERDLENDYLRGN